MVEPSKLSGGSIRIDLRGIQEGTHPVVREGGETPLVLDRKVSRTLRRFRFEGSLKWVGEDRRVRGFLSGTLETRCDRCLAAFDRELRTEIDLPVRAENAAPIDEASPDETGGDDLSFGGELIVSAREAVLDLEEVFRQAALLEVPLKNLCRADCLGICASCGVNLNEESCSHVEESCDVHESKRDPRWDALRRLSNPSEPEE